jgi:phage-related tail fiber protein
MVDQTSQFYAILTNVGAAKQANADALGIAWKITQMGVGDANGSDPTPNATQTSLINEWRRAPLNQLKVDDKNSAIIIAEQVIPADVGGKWIREIALYDADGDMVAVANCAPTYKPLLSQGSGRTQVVRMNLVVSSASNVQLKIDPAVVLATREWVTEELAKQDFKHSVLAATTANIALTGLQTVDGVALTAGARVLVKNQTAARDNGLYLVVAGGAWTRCADADTSAKVTPGMLVLVERGTVNGDSAWQLVTDAPITLGVTALAYEMAFGRSGVAAGIYRSVTVDLYGRVTAATNPTTVAGYGLTDVYTKTQIDQALALKAPLASPALTGVPTAPTAAAGNNTTQLASTAFVQAAISALVASSPAALDTLNELAAALGNDPNFATTMTNALALKAPLASPAFSGAPTAPTLAGTDKSAKLASAATVRAIMAQYGLASGAVNYVGSIDSLNETGVYMVSSATTGTKPENPAQIGAGQIPQGTVLHLERGSSNMATQVWDSLINTSSPITCLRTRNSVGAWTSWQAIVTTAGTITPARGDTSSKVATTQFVRESGLSFPSQRVWLESGDTLKQEHAGIHLSMGGAGTWTGEINLPLSGISIGSVFTLSVSSGMGTLVVNAPAVPGYIAVGTNALKTITLTNQDPPLQLVCLADGVYQVLCASVFSVASNNFPYRSRIFYKTAGIYQWAVPANVTRVSVHVRGGGGSGSFVIDSVSRGAGGGGAGGVCERFCAVTPGSTITVTVGAGGGAVANDGDVGINGGTSSFGVFCSATGGRGGNVNGGASGGAGIGGDFNASIGMGFPPVRNLNNTGAWGGQGGGGESIFAAADSSILTQPGMGGGGRSIGRSQPGVDGCVIITY